MGFAGYEVLGRVAQGSTGVVWKARQVELDRVVAIKELSSALLHAPGFLDRFRAEAQTLAVLDDPHVVRIYDYVEEPERAYLVQEWVDGAPLAAVLQQHGRLSPEQSLGVLRGGLMGLAHAHQRDLVHRDVSPANILLDREGTSKLVDFGLAAPTNEGITSGAATSVGTPAFSSPEAVTGAPMTTRSDVYSAAAVLFLLLSGRLPYSGDTAAVLQGHVSGPVPRLEGHGPELAGLVARAMAKNPDERPRDAAAFLAELEEAATQRYGAGWLDRASVAGLVTATLAGAATVTTGVATATPVAAAQAVAYGSASGVAAATRAGSRILGLPRAGFFAGLAAVVAVVVATTFIVTNTSSPTQTAAADSSRSPAEVTTASSEPPATTTAAPSVPAFSGSYAVNATYTAATGATADDIAVGQVVPYTWQVTPTCPAGPCDVAVVSSSGRAYDFIYSGGSWTRATPFTSECFAENGTGAPTGVTVSGTAAVTLRPDSAISESAPVPSMSGSGTDTFPSDCDGNPATYDYTLTVTRIGD